MGHRRKNEHGLARITHVVRKQYCIDYGRGAAGIPLLTGEEWVDDGFVKKTAKLLKLPPPDPIPYDMTLTKATKHFRAAYERANPPKPPKRWCQGEQDIPDHPRRDQWDILPGEVEAR